VSTPPGSPDGDDSTDPQEDFNVKDMIKTFIDDEGGLTAVEYAVAGGLIAAALVVAFKTLGASVQGIITGIDTSLDAVP
jgi:pilus assembly protein Flp/PilA